MRKAMILVMAGSLGLALAGPAHATSDSARLVASATISAPDPAAVAEELSLAVVEGATDSQIATEFDLQRVPTQTVSGVSVLSTTASGMNTQAPKLYYSSTGGYYYVVADWGWISQGWKDDAPRGDLPAATLKNVGGIDVYGVWFSKPIRNLNGSMAICGAKNGSVALPACYSTSSYKANNQYGEAVQFQDKSFRAYAPGTQRRTTADRGSLVFPFKFLSSGCQQFGSEYDHSWGGTSISGVGVQPYGLSVSWSGSSSHWEDVSAVASTGC